MSGFLDAHRHVALGESHVPEEYEAILAGTVRAATLLVAAHSFEDGLDLYAGNFWRQSSGAEKVFVEFE
jgi:hypothetical protein